MRIPKLIPVLLLLMAQATVAEEPIDTAVTIRNTVLRAAPATTSEVVSELTSNTEVEVFERQRLWVRIAKVGDGDTIGWLRFTELRFGTSAATESAAPKSSRFAGFSRSVSGFLSSFRGGGSRTAQNTSTIGIRGLTSAELLAAAPDLRALAAISRYAISPAQAEQFAGAGGLSARRVSAGGGK